ncbi:hypothetical protein JOM56_012421 [Amanita muscaria]
MRSVIICLLSLLFVPALGAPAENQGQPSSNRLPSVATHKPRIHLAPMAPINPPSTRPSSTRLPSIHQLGILQPSAHQPPTRPSQPQIHQPPTRPHDPVPPSHHMVKSLLFKRMRVRMQV